MAGLTNQPQARLVPLARPAPRPVLPQQLAAVLRLPGLGMGRGHPAVLLPHVPQATTRRQLAQSRSPPDDDGRRPHLARPRRGRLPARRLPRLVQRRRPARQPPPPRPPRRAGRGAGWALAGGAPALASSYYGPHKLHLVFNFAFTDCRWEPAAFLREILGWESALGSDGSPCFRLSNHDIPRHVSRYGGRH